MTARRGLSWVIAALVWSGGAAAQTRPEAKSPAGHRLVNPARLAAALELTQPGDLRLPRVRFEWPAVPKASAYLLVGSVSDKISWTVRSVEHRVTPANALEWRAIVRYEIPLGPGVYSWKLVAVYPDHDQYDLSNPATASFEVPR